MKNLIGKSNTNVAAEQLKTTAVIGLLVKMK